MSSKKTRKSHFFVSSILRHSEEEKEGGKLCLFDWDNNKIKWETTNQFPLPFCGRSANPRGGLRGWRGITNFKNDILVANNDSIVCYDANMNINKIISHPSWAQLHSLFVKDQYVYVSSTGSDTYSKMDSNYNIEVFEPLSLIQEQLLPYLKVRGRNRKPYNNKKDYREEWEENTLHLNYVVPIKDKIFGFFNSLNMFVQLEPTFEILYAPPLEGDILVNMPIDYFGLNCPHDILEIEENKLLINSSRSQRIYLFDLTTKQLELFYQADHSLEWLRGMEIEEDHIFVGTGRGSVLEINYNTRQLVTEKQVFQDYQNNKEFPYSIFSILKEN